MCFLFLVQRYNKKTRLPNFSSLFDHSGDADIILIETESELGVEGNQLIPVLIPGVSFEGDHIEVKTVILQDPDGLVQECGGDSLATVPGRGLDQYDFRNIAIADFPVPGSIIGVQVHTDLPDPLTTEDGIDVAVPAGLGDLDGIIHCCSLFL